jgi:hypothetical protein
MNEGIKKPRPRLKSLPASEQMKAWSAALAAEVAEWPKVDARVFFGFTALYRGDFIFGLLPRTRSMWSTNSIGFKLENPTSRVSRGLEQDPRVSPTRMQKARWFAFALREDIDLHSALDWLGRAYDAAGKKPRARS